VDWAGQVGTESRRFRPVLQEYSLTMQSSIWHCRTLSFGIEWHLRSPSPQFQLSFGELHMARVPVSGGVLIL
jgi:hypothetical protein